MTASTVADLSIEQLVEILADAGELDAGAEVLEAWRMREPDARAIVRLQARLFNADDVAGAERHAALSGVHHAALDGLARQGALLEVAVAYRALLRAHPDDALWRERLARIEGILAPLPNADHDPRRDAIDAMVARGALSEAFAALRELCREARDAALEQRAEALRALLFEPAHTRPYRPLGLEEAAQALSSNRLRGLTSPDARPLPTPPSVAPGVCDDPTRCAEVVREAIEVGDLGRALLALGPLVRKSPSPRWIRLQDALGRVRTMQSGSEPVNFGGASATPEPVSQVDRLVRSGRLREARTLARGLLARADSNVAPQLSVRLADLDVVLDAASAESEGWRDSTPRIGQGALEVAIVRTDAKRPSVRPSQSPEEVARGNVTAQRRRVVRLGDK
jgi:hypothetical protein